MITSARAMPSPAHVRDQAIVRVAHAPRIAQTFGEQLPGALHRRRQSLGILVLQRDGEAAQRAPGGDVPAHRAGTDHVHMRRLSVAVLAETLQAFLQAEHADQVRCRRRAEQRRDRRGIGRRRRERIAVVLDPEIEHRVGRRIVLAPRALRDLLRLPAPRCSGARAAAASSDSGKPSLRGAGSARSTPRAVFSMIRARHALVGDAELLRAARVDGLAGEQQVERGRRAREPRQPSMPPQPGTMPSITSGRPRRVPGSSTTTRYRHASASSSPPPRQNPRTSASVG